MSALKDWSQDSKIAALEAEANSAGAVWSAPKPQADALLSVLRKAMEPVKL